MSRRLKGSLRRGRCVAVLVSLGWLLAGIWDGRADAAIADPKSTLLRLALSAHAALAHSHGHKQGRIAVVASVVGIVVVIVVIVMLGSLSVRRRTRERRPSGEGGARELPERNRGLFG